MAFAIARGAVAAIAAANANIKQARAQFDAERKPMKPRERSLDEIAREHRRKMEAEHVETMRGAKVGTWLLGALFVAVIYAGAQLAGFTP